MIHVSHIFVNYLPFCSRQSDVYAIIYDVKISMFNTYVWSGMLFEQRKKPAFFLFSSDFLNIFKHNLREKWVLCRKCVLIKKTRRQW